MIFVNVDIIEFEVENKGFEKGVDGIVGVFIFGKWIIVYFVGKNGLVIYVDEDLLVVVVVVR